MVGNQNSKMIPTLGPEPMSFGIHDGRGHDNFGAASMFNAE